MSLQLDFNSYKATFEKAMKDIDAFDAAMARKVADANTLAAALGIADIMNIDLMKDNPKISLGALSVLLQIHKLNELREIAGAAAVAALAGMMRTDEAIKKLQEQQPPPPPHTPAPAPPSPPADPNAAFRAKTDPKANEPPGGINLAGSGYVAEPRAGETTGLTTTAPTPAAPTPSTPSSGAMTLPPVWQPPPPAPWTSGYMPFGPSSIGLPTLPWMPSSPLLPASGLSPGPRVGAPCPGGGVCR
ncbi:MAG: hypothetical protein HZC54_06850 [Verrucomicrobia bacterium]|nr:hypothetical protein [Verrucomicrobiota bacterium]